MQQKNKKTGLFKISHVARPSKEIWESLGLREYVSFTGWSVLRYSYNLGTFWSLYQLRTNTQNGGSTRSLGSHVLAKDAVDLITDFPELMNLNTFAISSMRKESVSAVLKGEQRAIFSTVVEKTSKSPIETISEAALPVRSSTAFQYQNNTFNFRREDDESGIQTLKTGFSTVDRSPRIVEVSEYMATWNLVSDRKETLEKQKNEREFKTLKRERSEKKINTMRKVSELLGVQFSPTKLSNHTGKNILPEEMCIAAANQDRLLSVFNKKL